jgi:hypothetical protein
MRLFDALPCRAAILLTLVSLPALYAQMAPSSPRPPALPGTDRSKPEEENDVITRQMTLQAAMKRNTLRQQRIVDDTAKLLELAQQLKVEVDKNTKSSLSVSAKKAEEIERLAKGVKDKMRDGQ